MAFPDAVRVEHWCPDLDGLDGELDMLADVLHTCVHAGASVSFVLPFHPMMPKPSGATRLCRDRRNPGLRAKLRF
jgi:hypothetical protein